MAKSQYGKKNVGKGIAAEDAVIPKALVLSGLRLALIAAFMYLYLDASLFSNNGEEKISEKIVWQYLFGMTLAFPLLVWMTDVLLTAANVFNVAVSPDYRKYKAEIKSLGSAAEQLRIQNAQLKEAMQSQSNQISAQEIELLGAKSANDDIRRSTDDLRSQNAKHQEVAKAQRNQISELEAKLVKANSENEDTRNKAREVISQLDQAWRSECAERDRLQRALGTLEAMVREATIAVDRAVADRDYVSVTLSEEVNCLAEQLKAAIEENVSLTEQLVHASSQDEVRGNELRKAGIEVNVLRAAARSHYVSVLELEGVVQASKVLVKLLEGSLATAEAKKAELELQIARSENLTADCRKDLAEVTSALQLAREEARLAASGKSELTDRIANLGEEIVTLRAAVTSAKQAAKSPVQPIVKPSSTGTCVKCRAQAETIQKLRNAISVADERRAALVNKIEELVQIFEPATTIEGANIVIAGGQSVMQSVVEELLKV